MFDALKNLGNLPGLMAKAREAQDRMKAMQEEMGRRSYTANSGGGLVEATVNGRMELLKMRLDNRHLDLRDAAMVEDLIVAAVAAAQGKAAEAMRAEVQRMTDELGLPPGMI